MSRKKIILYVVLTFLCGVGVGVAGARVWMFHNALELVATQNLGPDTAFIRVMAWKAELSDEQMEALSPVFYAFMNDIVQLHKPLQDERLELFEDFLAQGAAVLEPEAAERFRVAALEMRQRRLQSIEHVQRKAAERP